MIQYLRFVVTIVDGNAFCTCCTGWLTLTWGSCLFLSLCCTGPTRRSPRLHAKKHSSGTDRAGLKNHAGEAKKKGGGASYTWGLPGDEQNLPALSRDDPNYDSEAEEGKQGDQA
jgi:hypothetical protein